MGGSTKFNGNKCSGLAIGVKACEVIISKMNIEPKKDKIICITENNICSIDGIKYVFDCDYGKKIYFTNKVKNCLLIFLIRVIRTV